MKNEFDWDIYVNLLMSNSQYILEAKHLHKKATMRKILSDTLKQTGLAIEFLDTELDNA